jgi:hypothetical protein
VLQQLSSSPNRHVLGKIKRSKKSSESEIELKEDSKWSAHLETESCEDVRPDTVIKGGGHV